MLQVASNQFILQLFFCCLSSAYSSLPSAFCSSVSDCWTPTSALKCGCRGQAPRLTWEGDLNGHSTHDHSGETSNRHLLYGQSMENCTSWCRESRCGVGVSLTWPVWRYPTKSAGGFDWFCWHHYFFSFAYFFLSPSAGGSSRQVGQEGEFCGEIWCGNLPQSHPWTCMGKRH